MKQSRDAAALAASLTSAATSPLPLPEKETSSVVPLREGQAISRILALIVLRPVTPLGNPSGKGACSES